MLDLLSDNEFFRLLFKVMPVGMLVVDGQGYVQGINPAGSKMFCVNLSADDLPDRAGDLFRCVNAKSECGQAAACEDCILRTSAMLAIRGEHVTRQKGKFYILKDNNIEQFILQVTASPLVYNKETMALVIIEDVSLITEISGLIPICSCCHSIRNENGDWINVAKYLQENSEAELTHDYCPKCSDKVLNRCVEARMSLKK